MRSQPLVSVIIPCYNATQWISRTIRSIQNQTYENIEIIAIDDGSTDDTVEKLHESDFDPISILTNNRNQGIPKTKNKGIKHANGDFIAFLDQDDYWVSQKVEQQVRAMKGDEQIGIVYTDMYQIDGCGCLQSYKSSTDPPDESTFEGLYMGDIPCYNVSKMVRRRCFDEVGLLDTDFYGADDQDFDLRVAKHPKFKFRYIPRPLVLKRTHGENASGEHLQLLDDLIMMANKHRNDLSNGARGDEKLSDLHARRAFRNLQQGNTKKAYADAWRALSYDKFELKPYILAPAFLAGPFQERYLNLLEKLRERSITNEYTQKIRRRNNPSDRINGN